VVLLEKQSQNGMQLCFDTCFSERKK